MEVRCSALLRERESERSAAVGAAPSLDERCEWEEERARERMLPVLAMPRSERWRATCSCARLLWDRARVGTTGALRSMDAVGLGVVKSPDDLERRSCFSSL